MKKYFLYLMMFPISVNFVLESYASRVMHKPMQQFDKFKQWIKINPKKFLAASGAAGTLYMRPIYNEWKLHQPSQDHDDIFMIGNRKFSKVEIPQNMTREEWYKQKLQEQEDFFRSKILKTLKIDPDEFELYKQEARVEIQKKESDLKKLETNIVGRWIQDAEKKEYRRYEGSDQWNVFDIRQSDIDRLKKFLKDRGYKGELITLGPDNCMLEGHNCPESFQAYTSLITVRPSSFFCDKLEQKRSLLHELSHIKHNDEVFEKAIKLFVKKKLMRDDQLGWDFEKLHQQGLTLDDTDRALELLHDKWFPFHERRADLDALFTLKHDSEFQNRMNVKVGDQIFKMPQYQGYPLLNIVSKSPYDKWSTVSYHDDFFKGLENDAKRSQERK